MKKVIYLVLIQLLCLATVYGQTLKRKSNKGKSVDKVGLFTDFLVGILPMNISGILDKGNGISTYIRNMSVVENPIYRYTDTSAMVLNSYVHLGLNFPFFRSKTWSVGTQLTLGVGGQMSIRAAEGLSGLGFDFPQYLYFRHYKKKFDYTVLVGYKYTYSSLPYHLPIAAIEFNPSPKSSFKLYGSPIKYKYYRLLSNGTLMPMVQIQEYGLAYRWIF